MTLGQPHGPAGHATLADERSGYLQPVYGRTARPRARSDEPAPSRERFLRAQEYVPAGLTYAHYVESSSTSQNVRDLAGADLAVTDAASKDSVRQDHARVVRGAGPGRGETTVTEEAELPLRPPTDLLRQERIRRARARLDHLRAEQASEPAQPEPAAPAGDPTPSALSAPPSDVPGPTVPAAGEPDTGGAAPTLADDTPEPAPRPHYIRATLLAITVLLVLLGIVVATAMLLT